MIFLVYIASRTRLAVSRTNRESEIEIPSTTAPPRRSLIDIRMPPLSLPAFPPIGSDGI